MLVLTRKVGERIEIGDEEKIVLTIVGTDGKRIKIGIEADPTVPVRRCQSHSKKVLELNGAS